jgi:ubiquinone/menaquinone biosynthesis C-methylase UbiE
MLSVKKSDYVLDNDFEFKRLEDQAKLKSYCLENELQRFKITPGMRILDAGCGSGVVTKHLAYNHPEAHIDACDFSEIRIQQSKKLNEKNSSVEYHVANLANLPFNEECFDAAISRYVYEYLPDPVAVTKEIARVLKPGGKIFLIDLDGIFLNFWTSNKHFNQLLTKLGQNLDFDLHVGRKLPSFLQQAGLKDVQWEVSVHPFTGQELIAERENNRIRLQGAKDKFVSALGSVELYEEFSQLYLQEMDKAHDESNVMYFNKFTAWGTK